MRLRPRPRLRLRRRQPPNIVAIEVVLNPRRRWPRRPWRLPPPIVFLEPPAVDLIRVCHEDAVCFFQQPARPPFLLFPAPFLRFFRKALNRFLAIKFKNKLEAD